MSKTAKIRLGDLSMATRTHINITLMLCLKSCQTSLLYHRSLARRTLHVKFMGTDWVWLHDPLKVLPSNDITSVNLNFLRIKKKHLRMVYQEIFASTTVLHFYIFTLIFNGIINYN